MSLTFPYGFTLDSFKTVEEWDPYPGRGSEDSDESYETEPFSYERRLIIKTVMLGAEAKLNELNVLQIETEGVKKPFGIPITVLKMDKIPHVHLDLCIVESAVIFTLIKGSGPIHIVGQKLFVKRKKKGKEDVEDKENMENREDVEDAVKGMENLEDIENKENVDNFNSENNVNQAQRRYPGYRLWLGEPSSSGAFRQDPRDGEMNDRRQADLHNTQRGAGAAPGPSGSWMMQEVPVEGDRGPRELAHRRRLKPLSARRNSFS